VNVVRKTVFSGDYMLQKEMIESGKQIASDLFDAQISKDMGSMGGHIIKDISKYDNSDLIQKYIDGEIVSVEAIYIAMKRAEENGSSHNNESPKLPNFIEVWEQFANDNPMAFTKECKLPIVESFYNYIRQLQAVV